MLETLCGFRNVGSIQGSMTFFRNSRAGENYFMEAIDDSAFRRENISILLQLDEFHYVKSILIFPHSTYVIISGEIFQ